MDFRFLLAIRPELTAFSDISIGETKAPATSLPGVAVDRIVEAYHRAIEGGSLGLGVDMWTVIRRDFFGDFVDLLRAKDTRAIVDYLQELPRQSAGHGFYQGRAAYDAAMASEQAARERSLLSLAAFIAFGEATGEI